MFSPRVVRPLLAVLSTLALGCPARDAGTGTGGATRSGGAPGSGGMTGTGGGSSSGGATGSGGVVGTGGANNTGGANGTGGNSGTPGTGGSVATGGVVGSGGASGTGGRATGGATGTGGAVGGSTGTGGGAAGPCTAPGLILCDDFESRTTGAKPTGAPWLTTNCSATNFTLKVDTTTATSGTKSLASQGVPYGECMLHADLGTVQDFWVRARVRFAAGDATQFMAHELVAFDLNPTMNTDDPGIRVGFRGDNSCSSMPFDGRGVEVNITGGQEITGCTGFKLQADKWYCLELHVVRNASNATTAELLIDGADQRYNIHGMAQDTVVNTNPAVWRYLRVGARPYSSTYPWPIYIDDLAVGTQQIGCN